jgi:hypothetical protein
MEAGPGLIRLDFPRPVLPVEPVFGKMEQASRCEIWRFAFAGGNVRRFRSAPAHAPRLASLERIWNNIGS